MADNKVNTDGGNYNENIGGNYHETKVIINNYGSGEQLINNRPDVVRKEQSLTPAQRRHLEQKRKEQQQEYDYANEEIEFLSTAEKLDDLRPQERLRLQRQIGAAKQKRDLAASQIEALEEKLDL